MHRIGATNQGDIVPNQNPNGGRNVSPADESRQSWRRQDPASQPGQAEQAGWRGRGEEDREYRPWRDRSSYRDEDRQAGERDTRRWEAGRGAETGYSEDRDFGRSTERYGQGQSGYSAGRYGEDRSQQLQGRSDLSGDEDRSRDFGVDDRFTGRGRSSYWLDRPGGYAPERYGAQGGYGGGRGFEAERLGPPRSHERGYESRGYEPRGYGQRYEPWEQESRGYEPRGYEQRYEPRRQELRGHEPRGYEQRGYGGHGGYEQRMGSRYDQRTGYAGEPGEGVQYMGYQSGGPYDSPRQGRERDWGRIGEHVHRGTGPHRGKGPHGYQRSDERIREMVCEALSEDDEIDASQIQVSVRDGEVTLAGLVDDRHVKREAEDCVSSVAGVRDVQNQLRVKGERGAMAGTAGTTEPETSGQDRKYRA